MRFAMRVYTVHEPPPKRYESEFDPERFAFVRDGFSFWACVLGPLWMLRHRMWLVFFGYIVVAVALEVGLHLLGVSGAVSATVGVLLALLVGFEAGTLRRFTLGRRKWTNIGVIVGDDLESAERRFFDLWAKNEAGDSAKSGHGRPSAPALLVPPYRQPPGASDVIGLFPEPGVQR
jgi:hypothetical protein